MATAYTPPPEPAPSGTSPPAKPAFRAAQYVRMSTEHQQYSTHNQADKIREYADRRGIVAALLRGWQVATVFTAQSGRPFSVWNGAALAAGGDYNADGGGGAVGGGFYDRPDAPAPGTIAESFSQQDFLDGLFPASAFPRPAPGRNGTLGRNTFRGPRYLSLDASITRAFGVGGGRQLQVRVDVFNALNTLNLFLPNADLSLSNFGKSTQAFDARTMQVGARFIF